MEEFLTWLNANWQTLTQGIYNILETACVLILLFKRTNKKAINKKIDPTTVVDFSNYYIIINGQKYKLSELEIKKEI